MTDCLIFTHPACAEHNMGRGHPESPARLKAVMEALDAPEFAGLERREAPRAARDALALVHPAPYLERIDTVFAEAEESGERVRLDADTSVGPGSKEAALRAAGAAVAAVDAVLGGEAPHAFCAVRPPGHHAEPNRSMGFCIYSNAAIAGKYALDHHKLHRVAIVDFDVHHGNGTEAFCEAEEGLYYASTHQWPLYPGTGRPGVSGIAENVLNAAMPPGTGSREFREIMERRILPKVEKFQPELLIISAGFDAHRDDPLAECNLQDEDYGWATEQLVGVAERCCEGRVVSLLEGGYDLGALSRCTAQHVRALTA
jgi:acetoin utilization deacetylase AcuC-like enzyme